MVSCIILMSSILTLSSFMKKSDKEINFSDVTVKIQTDEFVTDFFCESVDKR